MSKENSLTKFIYMGDPQCSRLHGRKNDYSQWSALLQRALFAEKQSSGFGDEHLLVLGGDLVKEGIDLVGVVAVLLRLGEGLLLDVCRSDSHSVLLFNYVLAASLR